MNATDIAGKVDEVMAKGFELEPSQLRPEATLFEELGLDSLDAIDLVVHLEEELGVKVDAERFKDVRTLGDVHRMVGELVVSQTDA